MTVNTNLQLDVSVSTSFQYESDPPGIGVTQNLTSGQKSVSYSNGTNIGQENSVWATVLNIAANTTNTVNLANNSEDDPLNLHIAATGVKSVYFQVLGVNDTTPDGTAGTNATSVLMSGLDGATGFLAGTTPAVRAYNGAAPVILGTLSANGANTGLTLTFTNEDVTNNAIVLCIFGLVE